LGTVPFHQQRSIYAGGVAALLQPATAHADMAAPGPAGSVGAGAMGAGRGQPHVGPLHCCVCFAGSKYTHAMVWHGLHSREAATRSAVMQRSCHQRLPPHCITALHEDMAQAAPVQCRARTSSLLLQAAVYSAPRTHTGWWIVWDAGGHDRRPPAPRDPAPSQHRTPTAPDHGPRSSQTHPPS
jgi:hypothetical protein